MTLRELIEEKGYTISSFAKAVGGGGTIGVGTNTVRNWTTRRSRGTHYAKKITELLDINYKDLENWFKNGQIDMDARKEASASINQEVIVIETVNEPPSSLEVKRKIKTLQPGDWSIKSAVTTGNQSVGKFYYILTLILEK